MANISVDYTFANSTTADATQVNSNFQSIINGTSDGTKDFSISALTCAGTFTANGNVSLGNASSDDLSITASLASSLAIKTTATYNVGSSTLGLLSIYLGNSTFTTRLLTGATSSWSMTLPVNVPAAAGYALVSTTGGVTSWSKEHVGTATNDSATAGYIGEQIESLNQTGTTSNSGQYKDITSITLTAGDWDLRAAAIIALSGATSFSNLIIGIGTVSGNDATGFVLSYNAMHMSAPTSTDDSGGVIPPHRVSISSSTTYYLKVKATYLTSDIDYRGSIWARRVR